MTVEAPALALEGIAASPSLPRERHGACPGCGVADVRLERVWAVGFRYRCGTCLRSERMGIVTGSAGPDDQVNGASVAVDGPRGSLRSVTPSLPIGGPRPKG